MTRPATINCEAYYSQEQVKEILGLSNRAIGNACRSSELRCTERAGRRFFRGSWLIDWLDGAAQVSSDHNTESIPA